MAISRFQQRPNFPWWSSSKVLFQANILKTQPRTYSSGHSNNFLNTRFSTANILCLKLLEGFLLSETKSLSIKCLVSKQLQQTLKNGQFIGSLNDRFKSIKCLLFFAIEWHVCRPWHPVLKASLKVSPMNVQLWQSQWLLPQCTMTATPNWKAMRQAVSNNTK